MKKITILALVVAAVITNGCKPTAQAVDTHPANLAGKWKAEFKAEVRANSLMETEKEANVTIGITTETNGMANFAEIVQVPNSKMSAKPQTETISGSWKQIENYLIIEQSGGGFVAFRISSQSTNQLTAFALTGQIIQFNRIP